MGARSRHAVSSDTNRVSVKQEGKTFYLSNCRMLAGKLIGESVEKSQLYSLARSMAKRSIKLGIDKVDGSFDSVFRVIRFEGKWYQIQSITTPEENLLLPDFRKTEAYKNL